MGNSIAVVAKLEVTSVKKLTMAESTRINTMRETPSNKVIFPAIQLANPVDVNPSANAIPPPNKIIMPQGIFTASSQVNSFRFRFLVGIRKSKIAAPIAIMVSSSPGITFSSKDLKIQPSAASKKISPTSLKKVFCFSLFNFCYLHIV